MAEEGSGYQKGLGYESGDAPKVIKERRKRNVVQTIVSAISGVGWTLTIAAILFMEIASPNGEDMFTRLTRTEVSPSYNRGVLQAALFMLILVFVSCVIGFTYSVFRMRRKTDKYNKSIIIAGLASLAFIFVFLFRYGNLI